MFSATATATYMATFSASSNGSGSGSGYTEPEALDAANFAALTAAKDALTNSLLGPTGPTGPTGETGETGATGPAINQQNQSLFYFSNTFDDLNNFILTEPPSSTSPYYYNIQSNVTQGYYESITITPAVLNGRVNKITNRVPAGFFSSYIYLAGNFSDASLNNVAILATQFGSLTSLSPLKNGLNGEVNDLVYDLNNGILYAGGNFTDEYGIFNNSLNKIAKWNNNTYTWSPLGSGINGSVYALAIDSSNNLYAGGDFDTAGGNPANSIAKWDPNTSTWSPLGTGITRDSFYGNVRALAIDSNNNLYTGGDFDTAGENPAKSIAKWDPNTSTWSPLGSGITGDSYNYGSVYALEIDSNNDVLYVGGLFAAAGGNPANSIAKWEPDTSTWSTLGSGVTAIYPFTGKGPGTISTLSYENNRLYIGGSFNTAGGLPLNNTALIEDLDRFNNYVENTDGSKLYLKNSGLGSQINLLYYNDTDKKYSQVN